MDNQDLKYNFSHNLTKCMRDKGISQYELAGRIGVDRSSISRWVKMEMFPKARVIKQLAEYFNVPESVLIGPYTEDDNILREPYNSFAFMLQDKKLNKEQLDKLKVIIDTMF